MFDIFDNMAKISPCVDYVSNLSFLLYLTNINVAKISPCVDYVSNLSCLIYLTMWLKSHLVWAM